MNYNLKITSKEFFDLVSDVPGLWPFFIGLRIKHEAYGVGEIANFLNEDLFVLRFDNKVLTEYQGFTQIVTFSLNAFKDEKITDIIFDEENNDHIRFRKKIYELKNKKIQLEFQRELLNIEKNFFSMKDFEITKIYPPVLNDEDLRLSEKWHTSFNITEINNDKKYSGKNDSFRDRFLSKYSNDYQMGKMLSARSAEKAAILFLKKLGLENISDVSIEQLKNKDRNWVDYDIKSGDIYYDVKNSRRSRQNPNTYTEHIIPTFKEHRGHNVQIIGTLSNYLQPQEIVERGEKEYVLILGLTNLEEITRIQRTFNSEKLKVDFHDQEKQDSKYHFPPWVFEYPRIMYSLRNKYLEVLEICIKEDVDCLNEHEKFRIPFYLLRDKKIEIKKESLFEWEIDFISYLKKLDIGNGIKMPYIFLSVLSHFLITITRNDIDKINYSPERYKKILFKDYYYSLPLFSYDPLQTVNSLIDTLQVLWTSKKDLIIQYDSFKLTSRGVLTGRVKDGKWQTLVAYCGGWLLDGPCGSVPLVLGYEEHCSVCGKLICKKCGFCSKVCPLCKKRQEELLGKRITKK